MEKLRNAMKNVRVPQVDDKIYNDECIVSFDNAETETGIYICLNTFLAVGRETVEEYSNKINSQIFLHAHHIKKELPPEKEVEPEKKIARLAIGVEGGFNIDTGKKKYSIEKHHQIILLPDFDTFPYPDENLPEIIRQSVDGILKAESALHLAEIEASAQAWDGEVRQVTKHADTFQQLDNGVKVPPKGWKCAKCDKTDNLWLNLTDGTVLCGRVQLDGSGGNNHAVEYYQTTGYPLAVKLGTIAADGKADVYSYDEDDMVLDPNLVTHLAKFGINVSKMEKTEKTMLELEIDYNQRAWEWSRLTESGTRLMPKFGPAFTGMKNLGNSCYLNSVMQVLMTVPTFVDRFFTKREEILKNCNYYQAPNDFNIQMSKLGHGVLSGSYSKAPADAESLSEGEIETLQCGLSPIMFRTLVGKGHPEFSTKKQQDAMEFLEHVLKLTARNSANAVDAGHSFKFEVEDKFVCNESGKVRYVTRSDLYMPLPVPMEAASNKEEVADYLAQKAEAQAKNLPPRNDTQVHYRIPFSACLSKLTSVEEVLAFSSAVNKEVHMDKITRLKTFPDYLFVQLVKFGMSSDWQPVKYDVSVDMPDVLDLSDLKGTGLQPGEELMPETTAAPAPLAEVDPEVNETMVEQLMEIGFPAEVCRRAVKFTGSWGMEAAINWIMEHMDDPDYAEPAPSKQSGEKEAFVPNEEGQSTLMAMGFTKPEARLALKETNNNLERAADWIFSHQPQLESLLAAESGSSEGAEGGITLNKEYPFTNGEPMYELVAFISHMGTSIFVGHYVCHIKSKGEWTIFNDEKVYKSESPPKDLGYIYLYRRVDQ